MANCNIRKQQTNKAVNKQGNKKILKLINFVIRYFHFWSFNWVITYDIKEWSMEIYICLMKRKQNDWIYTNIVSSFSYETFKLNSKLKTYLALAQTFNKLNKVRVICYNVKQ